MARNLDARIRSKAHELWAAEGFPYGRDRAYWELAKEIVAVEESQNSTYLPANYGAEPVVEPAIAIENQADLPDLTDQGEAQPGPSYEALRADAKRMTGEQSASRR